MSEITLCPQCATRFKVSDEQLEAHDGLVRCGRCQNVFNARDYLQQDEPSPQLSLLIDEDIAPAADVSGDDTIKLPIAEAPYPEEEAAPAESDDAVMLEAATSATEAHDNSTEEASQQDDSRHPDLTPIPNLTALDDEPSTLAQQVQFVDDPAEEDTPAAAKPKHHMAIFLGTTLALLLTAQGTYYYRDALAVKLPGLKPLLVDLCERLDCSIELPRDVDTLSIVSSALEADAKLENVITLHALLHNRGRYAQAWPSLELTLTDSRDDAIARRTFHPADYLKNKDDLPRGIGHNREQEIALRLDTTDLRPSGYRLLLFYPQ
ncbi:MAG: DUF3426 domain-containing protein [Sideroxydans sp.]|nr:DUF3426 domain-containing protein [Sideroxydans sp.]